MERMGTRAPDFDLPVANPASDAPDRATVALKDFADAGVLVVVFMCNHCPYVVHIEAALVEAANDYRPRGVRFVGISANDAEAYPQDGFDRMAERARAYPFPYLYDATQAVAKAYGAVCTPDVFVYDGQRKLVYRGRFDATRPGMGEADGHDLRQALDEFLATGTVTMDQRPSMGCNIKWRPGNAPG